MLAEIPRRRVVQLSVVSFVSFVRLGYLFSLLVALQDFPGHNRGLNTAHHTRPGRVPSRFFDRILMKLLFFGRMAF